MKPSKGFTILHLSIDIEQSPDGRKIQNGKDVQYAL